MKQLFVLFFFISIVVQAQDYATIDAQCKKLSCRYKSAQTLANRIEADFNNDNAKVRAMHLHGLLITLNTI